MVEFDGTDDHLSILSMTNGISSAHSIFSVVKFFSDGGASNYVFSQGAQSIGNRTSFAASGDDMYWTSHSADTYLPDQHLNLTDSITLLSGVHTGGASSNKLFYANGSNVGQAFNVVNTVSIPASSTLKIGEDLASNNQMNGQVMELIIYKTALSEADRVAIESYLRNKWQKGVDGIATNKLGAHYDAMKAASTTTDVCATAATPATNNDSVQCWKDRSAYNNNVEQTTAGSQPTLVASNSDMGGERSVNFASDYLKRASSTGLSTGDEGYSLALAMDMDSAIPGTWEAALSIGDYADDSEVGIAYQSAFYTVGG